MSEHAAAQSGRAIATRGLKKADRAADLFCIELGIGSSPLCYPNLRSTVKVFHSFSDFFVAVLAARKRSALPTKQDVGGMPAAAGDNRVVRLHRSSLRSCFGGVGGYSVASLGIRLYGRGGGVGRGIGNGLDLGKGVGLEVAVGVAVGVVVDVGA